MRQHETKIYSIQILFTVVKTSPASICLCSSYKLERSLKEKRQHLKQTWCELERKGHSRVSVQPAASPVPTWHNLVWAPKPAAESAREEEKGFDCMGQGDRTSDGAKWRGGKLMWSELGREDIREGGGMRGAEVERGAEREKRRGASKSRGWCETGNIKRKHISPESPYLVVLASVTYWRAFVQRTMQGCDLIKKTPSKVHTFDALFLFRSTN